jgi:nucleosome binding factor SPN SPT16 subunit
MYYGAYAFDVISAWVSSAELVGLFSSLLISFTTAFHLVATILPFVEMTEIAGLGNFTGGANGEFLRRQVGSEYTSDEGEDEISDKAEKRAADENDIPEDEGPDDIAVEEESDDDEDDGQSRKQATESRAVYVRFQGKEVRNTWRTRLRYSTYIM